MPKVPFSELVAITTGEICKLPVFQTVSAEKLQELAAEFNAGELPSDIPLPQLTLEEIEIEFPVHFHIPSSPSMSQPSFRLMTTLPSPLFPQATERLNRFRITLKLNPNLDPENPQTPYSHE